MLRHLGIFLFVITLAVQCGCGGTVTEKVEMALPPDLSKERLTIDVWNRVQDLEKYDREMLKRLRKEEPSFKDAQIWKKFYQEVILPGFRRDVGETAVPPAL